MEGLELQKSRIEAQISEVRRMLGQRSGKAATTASAPQAAAGKKPRKKRELSAAARKRIAAAQKKRWAEYRKSTPKQ